MSVMQWHYAFNYGWCNVASIALSCIQPLLINTNTYCMWWLYLRRALFSRTLKYVTYFSSIFNEILTMHSYHVDFSFVSHLANMQCCCSRISCGILERQGG